MNTSHMQTNSIYQQDKNSYIHPTVKYSKRIFDLIFATFMLLILLPLLPFLMIAIKLDSKGPIFYQQIRLGRAKNGQDKLFSIIKFRTMYTDAEANGIPQLAGEDDPRITAAGKFLRKTRLDETPQLWNVLIGEMSLIGPRPERPELSAEIEKKRPFFNERTYDVLPGLTGLAQVNQSYQGSVHNIDEKLAYDHAYSLAISTPISWIKIDVKIFIQTILTVLKCNG
jgi:lipopolysaccharide/colanic/teichoic acid biosynthesis glycosyltransferase